MRRLIVMRHAKSDWHAGAGSDHSRPLNARGQREAPLVGEELAQLGFMPELVLSSDSMRTRETLALASPSWREPEIRFSQTLYLAGLEEVRKLAPSIEDRFQTVMVLGHNPGWEDMVGELTGKPTSMKTCYAAVLEAKGEGSFATLLSPGTRWKLAKLVTP